MATSINVFLHDALVGELRADQEGALSFKYADRYVRESGDPISLSMPLRLEFSYKNEAAAFFGGLLPEGTQKLAMALELKISPSDDLSMLRVLGKDCQGAITVANELPSSRFQFKQLTENAMDALINSRTSLQPALFANENVGTALPGAESVAPLTTVGEDHFLPIDGAPSNAILRPAGTVPDSPLNRYASMLLARRIGIEIPAFILLRLSEGSAIVQERLDRNWNNGTIRRVHLESFGQALSVAPSENLERDGGPGFVECIELINDKFPIPARDIDQFIKMFLFNILIGHHNLNVGTYLITHDESGPRVAGLKDTLCTTLNRPLSTELGMSVNGKHEIEQIGKDDWIQMAKRAGISGTGLVNRLQEMAETILQELEDVLRMDEFKSADSFTEKYANCLRENIRMLFGLDNLNGPIVYPN